ncbi:uncharacterized protein G2W53_016661 [Senna tora]|uniref:Uncharacterized protein n=1 Tax=Senna tora TaxID=362788 RepID=A0A834TPM8_9FABA|nr:uncharacterized protein G2W53_016661 [Senna tora]
MMARFLLRIAVVLKRIYPSRDGRRAYMWWRSILLLLFKVGSYAAKKELMMARATQWRRARKESMMLLLKVPVTSMEGVDDGTSYAVATSKEGVNDAATKGSGDKHRRS